MFYNIDQTTTPCVLQYTYCTLLYYLYSTVSPPTPTPTEHQQQQADSVTTITTSTIPLIAALHCMSLHPGVKLRHQVIHLNIVYVYVTVCMQGKQHALDHHTFDTHIVTTHNCGCPLPSFGGGGSASRMALRTLSFAPPLTVYSGKVFHIFEIPNHDVEISCGKEG